MKKVKKYIDFENIIESCGGGGSISSCGGSSNSGHTSCGGGSRVTSCGGGSGPSEDEIRRVGNARRRRNTNTPKICSECDVLTVASAKFCHNCGHEL